MTYLKTLISDSFNGFILGVSTLSAAGKTEIVMQMMLHKHKETSKYCLETIICVVEFQNRIDEI